MSVISISQTDPQNIAEIQLSELSWPWGTVIFYAYETHSRAIDVESTPLGEYWSSAVYKDFEADCRVIDVLLPSTQVGEGDGDTP